MASNSEQRIIRLEVLANSLLEANRKALLRLDTLEDRLRQSSGVAWGSGGGSGASGSIGFAATSFSPRSGITLGSFGTVEIYKVDPLSGTLIDSGSSVGCYCLTGTTEGSGFGISSGDCVWVEQDGFGVNWAVPVDCT